MTLSSFFSGLVFIIVVVLLVFVIIFVVGYLIKLLFVDILKLDIDFSILNPWKKKPELTDLELDELITLEEKGTKLETLLDKFSKVPRLKRDLIIDTFMEIRRENEK